MLNVLLVGCGRIARKHAQVITRHPSMQLVAAIDTDAIKLSQMSLPAECQRYSSIEDALSGFQKFDLAVIATESGNHYRTALSLIGNVGTLLVEKPLVLRASNARHLIKVARESGTRLNVVQQNRLNNPVRFVQQEIEAGNLGAIFSAHVSVLWNRDKAYYDESEWRGTWALDGGVMSNQANHHLDLLLQFLGTPLRVNCRTRNTRQLLEAEDLAHGLIEFESGALASFQLTTSAEPGNLSSSITLVAENGVVTIGGLAMNKLETWTVRSTASGEATAGYRNDNIEDVYGLGHERLYQHLLDNWDDLPTRITDPRTGAETVELVEKLYVSALEAREIDMRDPEERVSKDFRFGSGE